MEEVRQKSWFSRNWGWVLGGGCLTLIVVVVALFAGLFFKITDTVKQSEPYAYAFEKTIENEKVMSFLGTPIETNGIGNSSFNYKNGLTKTELTIPIRGPKDEAIIVVEAETINDEWVYNVLYVKIDGEAETINLLEMDTEESLDDF